MNQRGGGGRHGIRKRNRAGRLPSRTIRNRVSKGVASCECHVDRSVRQRLTRKRNVPMRRLGNSGDEERIQIRGPNEGSEIHLNFTVVSKRRVQRLVIGGWRRIDQSDGCGSRPSE